MKLSSRDPWFVFEIAIFLVANYVLLAIIQNQGYPVPNIFEISFFSWLLFGLAIYRGADIISNERIAHPLRAPFVRLVEKEGKFVDSPYETGFRGAVGALLTCPSCTGVWVAAALVYGYIFFPAITMVIILILSASTVERVLFHCLNILKIMHQK